MDFSDSLLEAYRDVPQLVDHLHSCASWIDRILMAMKRGHTAAQYVADQCDAGVRRPFL